MQTQIIAALQSGGPFKKTDVTVTTNKAYGTSTYDSQGIFLTPDAVGVVWKDGGGSNSHLSLVGPTDFTAFDSTQEYTVGSTDINPIFGGCADNKNIYLMGRNQDTSGNPLIVWATNIDGSTIEWAVEIDLSGSESYSSSRYNHITVDNKYVYVAITETSIRSKEVVTLHQINKKTGAVNWSREYYMTAGGTSYNVRSIDVDFKGNVYFTGEYASRGIKKIDQDGSIVWEKEISSPPIDGHIGLAWLDNHVYVGCVYSGDMLIVKLDDSDGSVVDDTQIEMESGFAIQNTFNDGSNGLVTKNEDEIIFCAPRTGVSPNRFYQMFIDPADLSINHSSRLESSIGNPINGSIAVAATGNSGLCITCQSGGNYIGVLNTDGDGGGDVFTSVTPVTSAVSSAVANVTSQSTGTLTTTTTTKTVTRSSRSNPATRNWTGI